MIRLYHKTAREKTVKELERFRGGTWIYAESPNEEELQSLKDRFELDLDLLEDALDPHEVPRMESVEEILYIYIRFPYKASEKVGEKVETVPMLIAVGTNFVATVCRRELPFLERLQSRTKEFYTTQKLPLLLMILTEVDEDYSHFLTDISRNIRSIRVQLADLDNKDIVRFVNFELILNDILAALVPMSSILQRLLFSKSLHLSETQKEVVEDLYLSAKEWQELSMTNLKAIVNIRQGYSTIMTNNLNRVIKILTVLTIILTIPTIISSIYGMNVMLPFAGSPYAFWGILGATVLISIIILFVLTRKKWV